jgi:exodeoxyribonuclease VII large subunit
MQAAAERLQNLSPLAILARGYSIVQTKDGRILRKAEEVSAGDELRARLSQGQLICRVQDVVPDSRP